MSEEGHFEKGVWVKNPVPAAATAGSAEMERRMAEAAKAVIASIDTMAVVTRDLVTTEEGKRYIEKTLKDTENQVRMSMDAIITQAKTEAEKARAGLDQKAAGLSAGLNQKAAEIQTGLNKKAAELDQKMKR